MASGESRPRLRFAPSPTGYLHIGGVRTALFNWLWARHTGGTFILRIEDTDRERSTEANEQIILRDLRWLGLDWDEGPEKGGAAGPYRQMERLPVYRELADKLIAKGAAYRCFCTKEELDAQREAVKAQDPKATFRYPGTCRDRRPPFPDRPWVLRLHAPTSGSVTYRDLVFGEVTTPNSAQQDVVLMRSDGVPLYNLGAVVDDITMGITLVARGRDHMINTPLQILLYEALGYPLPAFAHLPMMLAKDGQKLSKRHGAVAAGEYREQGIPPAGLLNYLVRFGWSFGDEEVFSLPDLIEKFDWARCGKSDGKFDAQKLRAIAFAHLKAPTLISDDEYVAGVYPFLVGESYQALPAVDEVTLRAAVPLVRERAQTWKDAAEALDYFLREEVLLDAKAAKKFLTADNVWILSDMGALLRLVTDFSAEKMRETFDAWLVEKSLDIREVTQPIRVAVTGRPASPGLFEVMAVLGRDRCLARLERGIRVATKSTAA